MSVKIEPSHRWVSSFKICTISRIISAPGWWQNRKWWWVAHDALFFALILHAMTCSKVTKFRDIQAWTHGNLLFCRYQIFKSKPNWLEALASFSNRNAFGPSWTCLPPGTRFWGGFWLWFLEMSRTRQPKMGEESFLAKTPRSFPFFIVKSTVHQGRLLCSSGTGPNFHWHQCLRLCLVVSATAKTMQK